MSLDKASHAPLRHQRRRVDKVANRFESTVKMMKRLATVMSCGAVATLCGGCLPPMLKNLNCSVINNLFEEAREMAAKGEVHFGIKVYENEAEIQQALAGNLQHYGSHWNKQGCPGSITADHWRLR